MPRTFSHSTDMMRISDCAISAAFLLNDSIASPIQALYRVVLIETTGAGANLVSDAPQIRIPGMS